MSRTGMARAMTAAVLGAVAVAGCSVSASDPRAEADSLAFSSAAGDDGGGDDGAATGPWAIAADHVVEIETFQFDVDHLDVSVGDTIGWTNRDDILHTVTSGSREYGEFGVVTATDLDELFDFSLDGRSEETASAGYTFDEPGRFSIICTIHPGIDMTVEVAP